MIILTAEEAAKVRGASPGDQYSEIDPVPLLDGTFMLGEHVLQDQKNADVAGFLAALPTVKDVSPDLLYKTDYTGPKLSQRIKGDAIKPAVVVKGK